MVPVLAGTLAVGAAYGSAFLRGGIPSWGPWSMLIGLAVLFLSQ